MSYIIYCDSCNTNYTTFNDLLTNRKKSQSIQCTNCNPIDRKITLLDAQGRKILEQYIYQGSTIGYFDISTLYNGTYFIRLEGEDARGTQVVIQR